MSSWAREGILMKAQYDFEWFWNNRSHDELWVSTLSTRWIGCIEEIGCPKDLSIGMQVCLRKNKAKYSIFKKIIVWSQTLLTHVGVIVRKVCSCKREWWSRVQRSTMLTRSLLTGCERFFCLPRFRWRIFNQKQFGFLSKIHPRQIRRWFRRAKFVGFYAAEGRAAWKRMLAWPMDSHVRKGGK